VQSSCQLSTGPGRCLQAPVDAGTAEVNVDALAGDSGVGDVSVDAPAGETAYSMDACGIPPCPPPGLFDPVTCTCVATDAFYPPFVPVNAQSCAGGLTCNGESCCTSINVPGGTFTQGGSPAVETNPYSSTVSSFALDKYEVTVGRFRKFVSAYEAGWRPTVGSGANPNVLVGDTSWQAGWDDSNSIGANLPTPGAFTDTSHLNCSVYSQTWTDSPGTAAQESRAINCVDWFEAFAFCIWDGGRLPTESEWEYAAAGGSENRFYPWGSAAPDCTRANFYNGYYCSGGSGSVVAVGSTPIGNGKWGHADLAGNVYEWAIDWYAAYSASASNDYANTTTGSSHVVRGGGFSSYAAGLRAAGRSFDYPVYHVYGIFGLRCSRTVQ
jgi:formylglycine-generating enzyme required for sulfatase activity